MERLTGWKENGRAYVIGCPEFELPEEANKVLQNLADKHAVIEDILGGTYDLDRLRDLVEAHKAGRCVVLPFPLHRMLLNTSDPYNPELMKDFRISATWTHCGIVFHSPWDIFLQNIEKGYIRLMREEAEAMLEGGTPDAKAD